MPSTRPTRVIVLVVHGKPAEIIATLQRLAREERNPS